LAGAVIINATKGSNSHGMWWTRKKVGEYIPPVNKGSLEPIATQQGWPTVSSKEAVTCPARRLPSAALIPARFQSLFLSAACELILYFKTQGASVRQFSGFNLEIPLWGWLWEGSSANCFIDGPLLSIAAVLLMPSAILCLLRAAVRAGTSRPMAKSRPASPKTKTE